MKIFIKLMILLFILACATPFFIKGQNGQTLMSLNKFKLPELPLPSIATLKTKLGVSNSAEDTSQTNSKGEY